MSDYWPKGELFPSYMTHRLNGGIPNWGFTHWWKMFNARQLLVHTHLLRVITDASEEAWPLDVREQALGAFQQYLRNQSMFVFWNPQRDTPEPMFSNANYHPKQQVVENCVFNALGRGNWRASSDKIVEGMAWAAEPWELLVNGQAGGPSKSDKDLPEDPLKTGGSLFCGSATELCMVGGAPFDLAITDPPFGNNLFYADLADFFYVWLRIPLLKWYEGLPERAYFEPARTPHAMEAIENRAEHPDNREEWEKDPYLAKAHLETVQRLSGNPGLKEKDPNPLFRRDPASQFYRQTLTACWAEAARLLNLGGILAFTFHHSAYDPWVDVLESLFNADYILVGTYPIRSDETKGEGGKPGTFGSQKIEYDIIHVCRKRLEPPQPVAWVQMRRWVRDEAQRLRDLLEHSHGKTLPESDLRVVLRGKALEFYSRHYGQVLTGQGQVLSVRDALLGINQLLDDLLAGEGDKARLRPPEAAEPASRLYLRLFLGRSSMTRDELHKTLRGTGVSPGDLEALGWLEVKGTTVQAVAIPDRFGHFTAPGRNRKVLKTDLDQAQFLIGAAIPGSGIDVTDELNRRTSA